jgi:micrococcal nuclease
MRTTAAIRLLLMSCLASAGLWATTVCHGEDRFVRVRWVDDGDTVVLTDGRRVRYIGINAPEIAHGDKPGERLGPEARDFNRRLLYRKKVRLELDQEESDQYGRMLAYVFLEDGTFVNGALVKSGHAYFVFRKPNTRYDTKLLALQREAMTKRAGMWRVTSGREDAVLGNSRSRRFHDLACPFGGTTQPRNRIIFQTEYDAFWQGFSPCRKCLFERLRQ